MAKDGELEKTHVESSDDGEDLESESESESEFESESEPEPQSQQPTLSAPAPAPAPESGSDSETDSDVTPHPVALKKPAEANLPATIAKRPAEKEPATKESKKSKNIFQRLFTDADVIVILQGMLELKKKISPTGTDEYDDFFEFIKNKLSADFTKAQVQNKIKRLRKNYKNQMINHNRNLTKTHDREVHSLFCKIWGDDQGKDMEAKKTPPKKSDKADDNGNEEKKLLVHSYGLTGAERVLKIGAELFEGPNYPGGVESAETWRKLVIEDMEADLMKLDVVRAQSRLVLDVLKSANQ